MSNNLISIIVPCYNQGQFLDETLLSVFNQTYANWECIIVNDGSKDNTKEIAENWIKKDSRYKYFDKENGGLSSARNLGLENVKGDFIQFLDSDDCIEKTKFEKSLNELKSSKNTDVKVVVSNFRMFTDNINNTSEPYCNLNAEVLSFENLLYNWDESFTIPIHCALFDSSLFNKFRFPEHLKSKEDWVMWVSLFHNNCKGIFINETLAFYRINSASMTKTKDMLPDFIKAYEHFKFFLTEEEYFNFSVLLISRFYRANTSLKYRLRITKESNTYQTGLLIKKVLKKMRVLKLAKHFFPTILKLKSK